MLLLERDQLTSGTTWHAAGLMVTFGSMSETSTELRKYTQSLYTNLEAETGLATGFKPVASSRLPPSKTGSKSFAAFPRSTATAESTFTRSRAARSRTSFRLARTDDILAGFYVKEDGRVNPVDVTMSMAKGAKMQGATIFEGVPVTGFLTDGGAVTGVRTPYGDIEAEYVVNCAGMWARNWASWPASISLCKLRSTTTCSLKRSQRSPPTGRCWRTQRTTATSAKRVAVSCWASSSLSARPGRSAASPMTSHSASFRPTGTAWGHTSRTAMSPYPDLVRGWATQVLLRTRELYRRPQPSHRRGARVEELLCGGRAELGWHPVTGAVWGECIAHWIVNGHPDIDVTGVNIDRLHTLPGATPSTAPSARSSRSARCTCRTTRRSRCKQRVAPRSRRFTIACPTPGAYFRDVSGWEGTDWFAPEGVEPVVEELSWGRQNWFPYWEAEHRRGA